MIKSKITLKFPSAVNR